jgi:hypothetical protein
VGTVTIDGEDYFADAIFAANGETHIYIGGPYDDVGIIQLASPKGSINFVSRSRASGGAVIGRDSRIAVKLDLPALGGVVELPLPLLLRSPSRAAGMAPSMVQLQATTKRGHLISRRGAITTTCPPI